MACFQPSLTDCNSVLMPVKYQFMGGEGKRASRNKIQRKANSKNNRVLSPSVLGPKKKKGVRHLPLHSCV